LEEAKCLILGKLSIDKQEIKMRQTESVVFGSEDNVVYTGQEAREIIEKYVIKENFLVVNSGNRVKLLEGTTACLGQTGDWVCGKVKIVNSPEDMSKMTAGDILVSICTTPDIITAMKIAGAIVTDYGGITSHAAIVSRELNVPCLIGVKYATKLFKDGDDVIVCPRHGYIKFQTN
jgi:phosphoenolpyruvate synthase/pyruvate phosphate dikinase